MIKGKIILDKRYRAPMVVDARHKMSFVPDRRHRAAIMAAFPDTESMDDIDSGTLEMYDGMSLADMHMP